MVLALDIDGTITRNPAFFAALSRGFRGAGHRVIIITFRVDFASTERDLDAWGIEYDLLVTSSLSEQLECGVNEWKGLVCERHGVQAIIDDDPEVLAALRPGTMGLQVLPA